MTIFINGKQKQVRRPPTVDGMDVDEFIRRNADPIWLHQHGLWEYMSEIASCPAYQPCYSPPVSLDEIKCEIAALTLAEQDELVAYLEGLRQLASRIVRLEGDVWRISSEKGKLDPAEQQELRKHFEAIQMPYRMEDGTPCILGHIPWEALYEALQQFYGGRAEVCPF